MSNELITMAFIYDFDGTLADGSMQEYELIPNLGMTPEEFWNASSRIQEADNVDGILAYLYLTIKLARDKNIRLSRDYFASCGERIPFFKGVETWFSRINKYGKSKGVEVCHYIISSGIREMIEGTKIASQFKAIYASTYMYDSDGSPIWPARSVNYTNKTQYMFRLSKGVQDETDDYSVNAYQPQSERSIPFSRMIYFGDGATDIPCMRLVKNNGGHAIMVYDENCAKSKENAIKDMKCDRISLAAPNDYSSGSMLERGTKMIIDAVSANAMFQELQAKGSL